MSRSRTIGARWLHGWSQVALLGTNAVTGLLAILIATGVLIAVMLIPGMGIGIVLLIPALWIAGGLGHAERTRIAALTDTEIEAPVRDPQQPLWRTLFLDAYRWRATAYFGLHALWGTFIGWVTITLIAQAVLVTVRPVIPAVADVTPWKLFGWIPIGSPWAVTVASVLAVVLLITLPFTARLITSVDLAAARWLLGRDERAEMARLSQRVDTLTTTRQEAVDSVEAERRRIERDLHDGPQQRLVAIAMSLGMARSALERKDTATARDLIDEAHASSKEAITEMRQVARGIIPPVLTDRGLDAAVAALADRCPIPVTRAIAPIGRLDSTIEAIAYFCISESLTNVAKHSRATAAHVAITRVAVERGAHASNHLQITVQDNGIGGADPSRGTGLTGLRQRVAAIDGSLTITSPPGGPTTVTILLPEHTPRSTP
ncbi:sensor histidine kinase [Janibacter sp. GXQ6167]|uniref:sensor histidine kinase n=1 Tax=Janibacter sp. GXQ6167 TaxID=3240791 RepID=UPI003525B70A